LLYLQPTPTTTTSSTNSTQIAISTTTNSDSLSWVDKYKPTSVQEIIGQQSLFYIFCYSSSRSILVNIGDKSCVAKLLYWLRHWSEWHISEKNVKRPKPPPWGVKNDDGNAYKAVLLSGAPGIGKTTSAVLCCKVWCLSHCSKAFVYQDDFKSLHYFL
jgi:replication factor C subunit 1